MRGAVGRRAAASAGEEPYSRVAVCRSPWISTITPPSTAPGLGRRHHRDPFAGLCAITASGRNLRSSRATKRQARVEERPSSRAATQRLDEVEAVYCVPASRCRAEHVVLEHLAERRELALVGHYSRAVARASTKSTSRGVPPRSGCRAVVRTRGQHCRHHRRGGVLVEALEAGSANRRPPPRSASWSLGATSSPFSASCNASPDAATSVATTGVAAERLDDAVGSSPSSTRRIEASPARAALARRPAAAAGNRLPALEPFALGP